MRNLLKEMQRRSRQRLLAATSYDDETQGVCTPAGRRAAVIERGRRTAMRERIVL